MLFRANQNHFHNALLGSCGQNLLFEETLWLEWRQWPFARQVWIEAAGAYICGLKCHVCQFLHEMPYLCGNSGLSCLLKRVQTGSNTIDSLNFTRYYWFMIRKGDIMFIFCLLDLTSSQLIIQSVFINSCRLCCYFCLKIQVLHPCIPGDKDQSQMNVKLNCYKLS